MAAEGKSTNWGTIADLSTTPVYSSLTLDAGAGGRITPGGVISNGGVSGTMGHFCVFRHDGGTEADWTEPFNFPVNGDFTIDYASTTFTQAVTDGQQIDVTWDITIS